MTKPTFTRKIIDNHGSLQVTIPKEIAQALELVKGDSLVFTWEDGSFTCEKSEKLC